MQDLGIKVQFLNKKATRYRMALIQIYNRTLIFQTF